MRSHKKVSEILLLVILSNLFFSVVPVRADSIIPPGWEPYTNDACGFTIYIPPGSEIRVSEMDDSVRIALPVLEEGTNLLGKDLTVECSSNPAEKALNAAHIIEVSESVFNNINFHIEKGEEGAAGSFYQAIKYSTEKDGKYPLISCVLQSGNLSMYGSDVTEFNYAIESAVCEDVMGSFGWEDASQEEIPLIPSSDILFEGLFAYIGTDGNVYIKHGDGTSIQITYDAKLDNNEYYYDCVDFSNSGKYLAYSGFTNGNEDLTELFIYDLETQQITAKIDGVNCLKNGLVHDLDSNKFFSQGWLLGEDSIFVVDIQNPTEETSPNDVKVYIYNVIGEKKLVLELKTFGVVWFEDLIGKPYTIAFYENKDTLVEYNWISKEKTPAKKSDYWLDERYRYYLSIGQQEEKNIYLFENPDVLVYSATDDYVISDVRFFDANYFLVAERYEYSYWKNNLLLVPIEANASRTLIEESLSPDYLWWFSSDKSDIYYVRSTDVLRADVNEYERELVAYDLRSGDQVSLLKLISDISGFERGRSMFWPITWHSPNQSLVENIDVPPTNIDDNPSPDGGEGTIEVQTDSQNNGNPDKTYIESSSEAEKNPLSVIFDLPYAIVGLGFLSLIILSVSGLVGFRYYQRSKPAKKTQSHRAASKPQVKSISISEKQIQQAIGLAKANQLEDAFNILRDVVRSEPNNSSAWFNLGTVLARMNRIKDAERCYSQAKKLEHPKADAALDWLRKTYQ